MIDITGTRSQNWTVVKYAGKDRWGNLLWLCRCVCGTERILCAKVIREKESYGCGCQEKHQKLPYGEAAYRRILASYKSSAKKHGRKWELDEETFRELMLGNCYYCGSEPNGVYGRDPKKFHGSFVHNGIDRVDNELGYVSGNVVSCCEICNKAKTNMNLTEFYAWVDRLYKNLNKEKRHGFEITIIND